MTHQRAGAWLLNATLGLQTGWERGKVLLLAAAGCLEPVDQRRWTLHTLRSVFRMSQRWQYKPGQAAHLAPAWM